MAFVMVQFSAIAYSPRLVLWFARNRMLFHALGAFTGTFIYALFTLAWVDRRGSANIMVRSAPGGASISCGAAASRRDFKSRIDYQYLNLGYVFATPAFGGRASLSMGALVGSNTTSAFGAVTGPGGNSISATEAIPSSGSETSIRPARWPGIGASTTS